MLRVLCLLAVLACASAYNVTGKTTVSGISAGGYMAVQYQVAFSSEVGGAGVFAGGPYFCSLGQLGVASTSCMSQPEILDVFVLVELTKAFASRGDIDPVSNLAGHKAFLYSGTQDTVVHPGVVHKLQEYYQTLGVNVTTEFDIASEHTQPTINYGNRCEELASPYLSKCNYDGAGNALQTILSGLKNSTTPVAANLLKIDQSKYFPVSDVVGLSDTAFLYVPTSCQQGAKCRVHVSFHGCNQELEAVGEAYVQNSGYNAWAESNNIIVLYPQAAKSIFHSNPNACFDWWGYTNKEFAFKTSEQLTTVHNMVAAIGTAAGVELK